MNGSNHDIIKPQSTTCVELGWAEKVVLVATRAYKPSYGGIANYRFRTASRETGITREAWDAAKQRLLRAGLLKPSNAITDAGRDAVVQFSSLTVLKDQSVWQTPTRA